MPENSTGGGTGGSSSSTTSSGPSIGPQPSNNLENEIRKILTEQGATESEIEYILHIINDEKIRSPTIGETEIKSALHKHEKLKVEFKASVDRNPGQSTDKGVKLLNDYTGHIMSMRSMGLSKPEQMFALTFMAEQTQKGNRTSIAVIAKAIKTANHSKQPINSQNIENIIQKNKVNHQLLKARPTPNSPELQAKIKKIMEEKQLQLAVNLKKKKFMQELLDQKSEVESKQPQQNPPTKTLAQKLLEQIKSTKPQSQTNQDH